MIQHVSTCFLSTASQSQAFLTRIAVFFFSGVWTLQFLLSSTRSQFYSSSFPSLGSLKLEHVCLPFRRHSVSHQQRAWVVLDDQLALLNVKLITMGIISIWMNLISAYFLVCIHLRTSTYTCIHMHIILFGHMHILYRVFQHNLVWGITRSLWRSWHKHMT